MGVMRFLFSRAQVPEVAGPASILGALLRVERHVRVGNLPDQGKDNPPDLGVTLINFVILSEERQLCFFAESGLPEEQEHGLQVLHA